MADFDVAIAGGGPVGASLAVALRGLRVALISQERRVPRAAAEGAFDARVYALSPGNVAFLRQLGVWRLIPAQRIAPVHAMHIFGDDGVSRLELDAYRAGVPELAWIVEDSALQDALWQLLEVEIYAPAQGEKLQLQEEQILLSLSDGRAVSSRLLVGADGAASFVRREAGIAASDKGYAQAAVVANFECEKPHGNVARQWFEGGPVLALLPLPGRQVSMVWSLPLDRSQRVAALDGEALAREVEAASRRVLGALRTTSTQRSYPLRRLKAERLVKPRIALAGDAGHVIHPLAGQGLNVGLQDAQALAATLMAREPSRDPGDLRLLRRYERSRAEPILAMDAVVDGLFRLFEQQGAPWARLRNTGLNLTDKLPVLKNLLIRQAMG